MIPNKLEENVAPSGLLFVTGGICCAMMLLRGSERPRTPSKSCWRGSSSTEKAAAVGGHKMVSGVGVRVRGMIHT